MVEVSVSRTPTSAPPPEAEIDEFFQGLEPAARRFMPVEAADVLGSSFLAWARSNGQLKGIAGCISRKGLLFLHIAVSADPRGTGLGRRLLNEVLSFGQSRNAAIFLSVHAENAPAVGLYLKLGFKIVAQEP